MNGARIDFALIQPLVYSLETWMELRTRLRAVTDGRRPDHTEPAGTIVHRERRDDGVFDRSLESAPDLPSAFSEIFSQTRAYRSLAVPVPDPSAGVLAHAESWPAGLAVDGAATWLLLPGTGEPALIHLCSGLLDPESLADPNRHLQRDVRAMLTSATERHRSRTLEQIEGILERVAGGRPSERVADVLEQSGGHLVTFSRSTGEAVVEALGRVHRIEEGTAENQRHILFPDGSDEPCFLHLGWSYSTVATPRVGLSYRLLFPLVAVNQAWYRYRELRGDLIDMSRAIDDLDTDRELSEQTDFYNRVVLQVRVWEAEREGYERGLKPVYRSVYDALWRYWDTDESRGTVHDGIDVTRDFLDRKFNLKIALRENTQSKILFVIAIFQLLSVFGLVSGYLYFWEQTRLPEAAIFGSEITVWVTLLSPLVVLILIVGLLVGFLRRNR